MEGGRSGSPGRSSLVGEAGATGPPIDPDMDPLCMLDIEVREPVFVSVDGRQNC